MPGNRSFELLERIRTRLWTTAVRLWEDNIADYAAALTYYAVLALVPALLVPVSLVGLAGTDTRERLIRDLTSYAPPQSAQVLREALEGLTSGVLLALLVTGAARLVATGPVARRLAAAAGSPGTDVMTLLRWPVLLVIVTALILILYRTRPVQGRGLRRGFAGGALAAFLWLGASAPFTLYTPFGTYSRLYGSLAGVVAFLVWLWFGNLALLAGAQFNAVRARQAGRSDDKPREVEAASYR
ncbi:YihY family inner membrane protein [Streptomyces sp. PanSC19]|uniref:YihY/virulence factor BrkB family protein n=1 Tax=Streptomyces sp. PanSC19 TaxID=1520455 RepID=UPI000F4933AB|nr:YihY/virulence factor BrkB family protein [Streptomyces sp. PanSC19]ROQ26504.1 YihY family inner membrane protein [Streptomyces sp. PanSC19]